MCSHTLPGPTLSHPLSSPWPPRRFGAAEPLQLVETREELGRPAGATPVQRLGASFVVLENGERFSEEGLHFQNIGDFCL